MQRMNLRAPAAVLRVRLGHPPGDQIHFRARLLQSDARFEPAIDRKVVRVPLIEFVCLESQRGPNFAFAVRTDGSRRHYSNDGVRLRTQRQTLAHDIRVASKSPPPQLVAEKHDAMIAESFFFR